MALIALSGCTTPEEVAFTAPPSGLSSGQARQTGTFPNLNIPPQVAASQISEGEKAEKLSELQAAQASQAAAGQGNVPKDEALLKKLATTHGKKTLQEIEGK
ncbi:hypothetical protein [Mesorhizobium sp. KR2-14]|uniref:hypothetical protein n=1 Tax=Mesorhizobium sp. KR2-14 TaxID=3156610 RepID=UPI0032B323F6